MLTKHFTTFFVFASLIESNLWAEARKAGNASFDDSDKMDVSIGHLDDEMPGYKLMQKRNKFEPWRPEVQENVATPPNGNFSAVGPEKTTFLLYQPFHSMDIRHFIWDELLSLFSLLYQFGVAQDEGATHVPLFVERTETFWRKRSILSLQPVELEKVEILRRSVPKASGRALWHPTRLQR
jgi:hypothetical protein